MSVRPITGEHIDIPVSRRRVLLIDDNPAIHEDYRKILGGRDGAGSLDEMEAALFGGEVATGPGVSFDLDSAYQGQDGHAALRKSLLDGKPYALAFVDVRMPPGWDGIETIQHLWEDYPDLEVVICTAYSDYSWADMIRKTGRPEQVLILKKPFDPIEVLQLAHALTEKWQLRQEMRLGLKGLQRMLSEIATIVPEARGGNETSASVSRVLERARSALGILTRQVSRREQEFDEIGQRDALTGLWNRAHLDAALRDHFEVALANGRPLSVLFCDIDWFKKVNDSRGHAAGDAALQSVAALLRGALREPDIVARYGGEEFVCLLPNTNAPSAALVAERLRTGVAERKHDVGVDTMIDLTISIGCATTSAHAPLSSVKELLAAADRRLYLAKQRGRNRVVAEDAPAEPGAQRS